MTRTWPKLVRSMAVSSVAIGFWLLVSLAGIDHAHAETLDASPGVEGLLKTLGGAVGTPRRALHLVTILTIVSLLPALVLTCTCFARFVVVFSFLRSGLGTSGAPPNQILVGLALFMTIFVMAPVGEQIHEQAWVPYTEGAFNEKAFLEAAAPPLRSFLLDRTQETDLSLFYEVSESPRPTTEKDVPLRIAVPAFVLSELRTAFRMGFLVLLPFLVIDLIVATVLSSLGMVMLPPTVVALPIKILVFVGSDGWQLLVRSLLKGAL